MSAEYEDVLTNRPVVIANVRVWAPAPALSLTSSRRALALSGPVSQGSSTQNVSFRHRTRLARARPIADAPRSVGRPKHTRVLAGAFGGDVFIGRRATPWSTVSSKTGTIWNGHGRAYPRFRTTRASHVVSPSRRFTCLVPSPTFAPRTLSRDMARLRPRRRVLSSSTVFVPSSLHDTT